MNGDGDGDIGGVGDGDGVMVIVITRSHHSMLCCDGQVHNDRYW